VEFERSPIAALAEILKGRGFASATIGVEKRYLMAEFFEELTTLLPNARFVSADRVLEVARAAKIGDHIAVIGDANRATEVAVSRAIAATRPGDSERKLASRIIQAMFDEGAHTVRHAVVTAGDNARHAHPYPSASKILTAGDIIRIDVGGLFGGFGSDIARMAIVGDARADQRELYERVRGCVHHVGPRMTAGMSAADIYQAAVDYYASVGIPEYRRDHVGHSLSILGGHDNPMLHSRDATILEDGMVIAFEPILRDSEGRRYTVEDIFVIGKGGAELLTTATDTSAMAVVA
jgi:Xaa-Pro dipeptidase